jgi:hypothetical protein
MRVHYMIVAVSWAFDLLWTDVGYRPLIKLRDYLRIVPGYGNMLNYNQPHFSINYMDYAM